MPAPNGPSGNRAGSSTPPRTTWKATRGGWTRHRAAWAEEVKRSFRFLDRKLAVRAFARFAAGAILLLPLALARALGRMAKAIPSGASPQPRLDETAPRFAHRVEFQLRIRGLDEPQGYGEAGLPTPGPNADRNAARMGAFPSSSRSFLRPCRARAFVKAQGSRFRSRRWRSSSHRCRRRWCNAVEPACRSAVACGAKIARPPASCCRLFRDGAKVTERDGEAGPRSRLRRGCSSTVIRSSARACANRRRPGGDDGPRAACAYRP